MAFLKILFSQAHLPGCPLVFEKPVILHDSPLLQVLEIATD